MPMEDLIGLYEQRYDPLCPVVCYDELPFQLLGDTLVPIPMKPGKIYRIRREASRPMTDQISACGFRLFLH